MRYLNAPSSAAIHYCAKAFVLSSIFLYGCSGLSDKSQNTLSETSEETIVTKSQKPHTMNSMWIDSMLMKDIRNVHEEDDGMLHLGEDVYTYALRSDMAYLYQQYNDVVIEKRNEIIESTGGKVCPSHPDFYNPEFLLDEKYRKYDEPKLYQVKLEFVSLAKLVWVFNEYNDAVDACRQTNGENEGYFSWWKRFTDFVF